jgi:predicted nucleic acid-binding protein
VNCFLDTSALVKLFHEEPGSDIVEKLVVDENNDIWVCELVRLEFLSSVYKHLRQKELTENEADNVIQSFEEQLRFFNVEPLGSVVLNESEALMKEYGKIEGLRSLDALHLAACRLLAEKDWVFVCSDSRLCDVARKCGIAVNNPMIQ